MQKHFRTTEPKKPLSNCPLLALRHRLIPFSVIRKDGVSSSNDNASQNAIKIHKKKLTAQVPPPLLSFHHFSINLAKVPDSCRRNIPSLIWA